jgi:hypothetical protein
MKPGGYLKWDQKKGKNALIATVYSHQIRDILLQQDSCLPKNSVTGGQLLYRYTLRLHMKIKSCNKATDHCTLQLHIVSLYKKTIFYWR